MSTKTALVLVAGFIAGCGAAALAPLVVPPANAQTTTRWETLCAPVDRPRADRIAEDIVAIGNRAGAEGWELVSAPGSIVANVQVVCFKRPAQ